MLLKLLNFKPNSNLIGNAAGVCVCLGMYVSFFFVLFNSLLTFFQLVLFVSNPYVPCKIFT